MGAVVNMRPDLFNAAIFGVPFVDCLTTMLDETIPLTVIEVSLVPPSVLLFSCSSNDGSGPCILSMWLCAVR